MLNLLPYDAGPHVRGELCKKNQFQNFPLYQHVYENLCVNWEIHVTG